MFNTAHTDTALAQAQPPLQSPNQAAPFLDRAGDQVGAITRHGIDTLHKTSHQLKLKAERVSDNTVSYIQNEPVKSVLIAAATGAVLMALLSLVARSRSHG